MQDYLNILERMPDELRHPMVEFAAAIENRMRKEFAVTRQDFTRLESIVAELAHDQKETRARLDELVAAQKQTEKTVSELVEAQKRTDQALAELAAAQKRTDQALAELAAAQKRTEQTVAELAVGMKELREAQKQTEKQVARLDRTMYAVGARWGIHSETSFREALKGILTDLGFEVERYLRQDTEGSVHGHPAQVELDVVIRDGKLILLEIKSSMSKSEVYTLERVVKFYEKQEGQSVDRKMIVCPFLKPGAMEAAEGLGIEVFTDISEIS